MKNKTLSLFSVIVLFLFFLLINNSVFAIFISDDNRVVFLEEGQIKNYVIINDQDKPLTIDVSFSLIQRPCLLSENFSLVENNLTENNTFSLEQWPIESLVAASNSISTYALKVPIPEDVVPDSFYEGILMFTFSDQLIKRSIIAFFGTAKRWQEFFIDYNFSE